MLTIILSILGIPVAIFLLILVVQFIREFWLAYQFTKFAGDR